ncbi:MAG TPA: AAA family ATPase [Bacteroidia bacterium]|nr:AAA family ATPase [Bacteroidia bacterium]
MDIDSMQRLGKVITFYSFKGGVGRTMALSNVAALLAKWQKKVLIVDFDLEAPGVEKYFTSSDFNLSTERSECPGVVDILTSFWFETSAIDWSDCVITASSPKYGVTCDILTAGKDTAAYASNLQNLNWDSLFEKYNLAEKLERMRNEWKKKYDYILVDSRTGISDIGGICTIYLPDIIAFLFTTNDASLNGSVDVIKRAKASRDKLAYDRSLLVTIPIPSRDESRTEYESSLKWKDKFADKLDSLYADWLPMDAPVKSAIDLLKIPYVPYWSFGDRLPVLEDGTTEGSIGFSYERIALLIANDFDWTKTRTGLTSDEVGNIVEKNERLSEELDARIEQYIVNRLDVQIEFYAKQGLKFKWFNITSLAGQFSSALILPTLIFSRLSDEFSSFTGILFSAILAVLIAIQAASNWKTKSEKYIVISQALKHEKFKFMSLPKNRRIRKFQSFVSEIEDILANADRNTYRMEVKETRRMKK